MTEIRAIDRHDQPRLERLIKAVFREYGAPQVNTVYDDPRTERVWEDIQGVNAGYWVVVNDDEVVGGCGFYPTEGLPEGYAELVKFYLSPTVRGLGFGSKVFQRTIEEARRAGYSHLYIESFPQFEGAVAMYLRHGFRPVEHRLGQSGHGATSIFLVLEL